MKFVTSRTRQALATLLVGTLPGAAYFCGELFLSGYTRRPDGGRDLGHVEKLLGGDAVITFVLLLGLPTIGAGLLSLGLARVTGRVTALRLMPIAAFVGALIPFTLEILSPTNGGFSSIQLAGPVVAGCLMAFVLSGIFCLVAGVPLRAHPAGPARPANRSLSDAIVVGSAAAITIAALISLGSLYAWGVTHPCTSCG
ncbi:MAG TPA: hypothetical protein VG407_15430 [Caulobacteraceae bacterium]|jgi:hypothetical protein|nr:hypothetical protein [Caulobacteraceae bacterium]